MESLLEIWRAIDDSSVLVVGAVLFVGAVSARLVELVRLPSITGYIIAGLALGPQGVELISESMLKPLHVFTLVSLGAIAFNIGSEFDFPKLRQIGGKIAGLALSQFVLSLLAVTLALVLIGVSLPYALLLGALATSTAPTTTYALVASLGVHGQFVTYLYGVLALNDALCVLTFGVVASVIINLLAGESGTAGLWGAIVQGLGVEIWSILVGAGAGLLITLTIRAIERDPRVDDARVKLTFMGLGLITVGATTVLQVSHLLVPMTAGLVMTNLLPKASMERIQRLIAPFGGPLFLIFLVLAGAQLEFHHVNDNFTLLVVAVFWLVRLGSKYLGVFLAGKSLGLNPNTGRYLGLGLAAQGGLVIGLLLSLSQAPELLAVPPEERALQELLRSAVLIAVLLGQLVGPAVARYGILRGAATTPAENQPSP